LGLCLGGRQEARAQAGCGDHRLTNPHTLSPRRGCGRRYPTRVTLPRGELFLSATPRCSAPSKVHTSKPCGGGGEERPCHRRTGRLFLMVAPAMVIDGGPCGGHAGPIP